MKKKLSDCRDALISAAVFIRNAEEVRKEMARLVGRVSSIMRRHVVVVEGVLLFRSREAWKQLSFPKDIHPRPPANTSVASFVSLRSLLKRKFLARPTGVVITQSYGRWGNTAHQLLKATGVALRFETQLVVRIAKKVPFLNHFEPVSYREVIIRPSIEKKLSRISRVSNAFWSSLTREAHWIGGTLWNVSTLVDSDWPPIERQVAAAFKPQVLATYKPAKISPEVLVIHLRDGDVFTKYPHPEYGQPPFAFYLKVFDQAVFSSVLIVRESGTNPVEALLEQELTERKISFSIQSQTFSDDLGALLGASQLVASKSTLTRLLVLFSKSLREIYFFNETSGDEIDGVTRHVVKDNSLRYAQTVQNRNWKNSLAQRNLMVSYPKEALA